MISEIEQKLIDNIQCDEDIEKTISIVQASSNPFFLLECALNYNWNDGFPLLIAIAKNKHCDLGTALNLFSLAGGMSYFTKEVERNEYNNEWADFCEMLIQDLVNKVYAIGPVSFNSDINKLTQYKYKKAGIPSVLYQEVIGEGI